MADARIHITGASCAGVTTLGTALALRLGLPHVDTDDAYWMPTDPPYTTKRPVPDRLALMRDGLGEGGWVLSGSLMGWGEGLVETASLIVFVITPTPVRMARLDARQSLRHGARILPGGDMHAGHLAFRDWAAAYDRPDATGRSRAGHEAWLATRKTPVLRLDGREPTPELTRQVVAALA